MYGAMIERGKIIDVQAEGYKIQSYTRDGLTTPFLKPLTDTTYEVGDFVYFFLFADGQGAILGKITEN